jgi:CDP-diglyceride synthetase
MSNFFPMPSGDRWFLLTIIIFSIIAFLPWTQRVHLAGMALFGWLMAALMILSPAIALIRLIRHRVSQGSADFLVRDERVD